jgi:alpha-glucosidase (family GH31 glycosyl hydrolase)
MVDGYKAASMPLESVWLNPDVSKSGANFEVNTDTYPDLASYRATLDATNQKIVLTKYAGIDGTVLSDHYMIEGQAD